MLVSRVGRTWSLQGCRSWRNASSSAKEMTAGGMGGEEGGEPQDMPTPISFDQLSLGDRRSALMMIDKQSKRQLSAVKRFFFELVQSGRAKTLHYNIYFRRCRLRAAMETYQQMLSDGIPPDAMTFGTIISKAIKARSNSALETLAADMQRFGVSKDIVIYNQELEMLYQEGKLDACLELVEELIEKGITPNLLTHSRMIWIYTLADRYDEAKKLFWSLEGKQTVPSVLLISAVVKSAIHVKNYDDVEVFLNHYRQRAAPKILHQPFSIYMEALSRDGNEEKMLNLFKEMQKKKPRPNPRTYASLLFYYGLRKDVVKVNKIHAEMKIRKLPRTAWYYTNLIYAYSRNGENEKASFYHQTMHQAGPSPNNRTLMVLLSHYARLGEYEQIQELWSNLFESASIPKASDYYRVLFLCYGRIGGGYVRTLWDKLKQEKIWIDRELFKILRDIAVHYKMKTFEKDLEKTWEKLIELHNSHIEPGLTKDGFLFHLLPEKTKAVMFDLEPFLGPRDVLSTQVFREDEARLREAVPSVSDESFSEEGIKPERLVTPNDNWTNAEQV